MDETSRAHSPAPAVAVTKRSIVAHAAPESLKLAPASHHAAGSRSMNDSSTYFTANHNSSSVPAQSERRRSSGGAYEARSHAGENGHPTLRSFDNADHYRPISRLVNRPHGTVHKTRHSPYPLPSVRRSRVFPSPNEEDIGSFDSSSDCSDQLSDSSSSVSSKEDKLQSKKAFVFSPARWNSFSGASSSRASRSTHDRSRRYNYDPQEHHPSHYKTQQRRPQPQRNPYPNHSYHHQHRRLSSSVERHFHSHPYRYHRPPSTDYREPRDYRETRYYDRSAQTSPVRVSPVPRSQPRLFIRELTPTRDRRAGKQEAPSERDERKHKDEDELKVPPMPPWLSPPLRPRPPPMASSSSSSRALTHKQRHDRPSGGPITPRAGLLRSSAPSVSAPTVLSSSASSGSTPVASSSSALPHRHAPPTGIESERQGTLPESFAAVVPSQDPSELSSRSVRTAVRIREDKEYSFEDKMAALSSRRKNQVRSSQPSLSAPLTSSTPNFILTTRSAQPSNKNGTIMTFRVTTSRALSTSIPASTSSSIPPPSAAETHEKMQIPSFKRGGKTRYVCMYCPKDFSRKNDAYRHMGRKHNDNAAEFVCVCGRVLSRWDALTRHQRTCSENKEKEGRGGAGGGKGKGKGKSKEEADVGDDEDGEAGTETGADDDMLMEDD